MTAGMGPRRPGWLVPVVLAVAAVVIIAVSAGGTVLASGSTTSAAPPTTTSVHTRVVHRTVTSEISSTVTTSSTLATTMSARACTDGSTVITECAPYKCWDGTTRSEGPCPKVTGAKALQWIYSADGSPARTCKNDTADLDVDGATALEVQLCTWSDLKSIYVYLQRWPSAAAAKAWADKEFGPSEPVSGTSGNLLSIEWELVTNDHRKRIIFDQYPGLPYTLEVLYAGDVAQSDSQMDSWFKRQIYVPPPTLAEALAAAEGVR